jgi:hypothetical protein
MRPAATGSSLAFFSDICMKSPKGRVLSILHAGAARFADAKQWMIAWFTARNVGARSTHRWLPPSPIREWGAQNVGWAYE